METDLPPKQQFFLVSNKYTQPNHHENVILFSKQICKICISCHCVFLFTFIIEIFEILFEFHRSKNIQPPGSKAGPQRLLGACGNVVSIHVVGCGTGWGCRNLQGMGLGWSVGSKQRGGWTLIFLCKFIEGTHQVKIRAV